MAFTEPAVAALMAMPPAAGLSAVCAGLAQCLQVAAAPHRHSGGEPVFDARSMVLIELFFDAYEAAASAGLRAGSAAAFLNTHHSLVQGMMLHATAPGAAGAVGSAEEAHALFDRLMVADTVGSFEENAAVVAASRAVTAGGGSSDDDAAGAAGLDDRPPGPARYSLEQLKRLSRHVKTSGLLALYDLYRHALTRPQRAEQVVCEAQVETPFPPPPLADARQLATRHD